MGKATRGLQLVHHQQKGQDMSVPLLNGAGNLENTEKPEVLNACNPSVLLA